MDLAGIRSAVADLDRRQAAAGAGVCLLLVLLVLAATGDLAFLLGLDERTVEASPASVEDGVADDAGYRSTGTDVETVRREATVLGVGPRIRARNHVEEFRRTVEVPPVGEVPAAMFVVVSTPQTRTLGRPLNPVGRASGRELLDRAEERYGGLSVDRKVGERTVRTLGTEATVEHFRGSTVVAGLVEVDLALHVTVVPHEGDYVVAVGVHPAGSGEVDRVDAMIRGLDRPTNSSADPRVGDRPVPRPTGDRP